MTEFAVSPVVPERNPFLRGPCFATGSHSACAGIGYQWPAPAQPGDKPEKIRVRNVVFRCPCLCGHPEWRPTTNPLDTVPTAVAKRA